MSFNSDKMSQESLPNVFEGRMRQLLGDDYEAFERALEGVPTVSLRVNPRKAADGRDLPAGDRVPWCETGRYLTERPAFTFDPLLHAGAYYVQEAASMFLERAVGFYVTRPVVALDLCAAPGGKSTHLISTLPEGSLLVSNETIRSRSRVLAENMAKWGASSVVVTQADAKGFGRLTHRFDLIVADMPCSGEGMFRKTLSARAEWSLEAVRLCAARQRRIVHDVWPALRPGGLFIYSTCTFNTEENEDNLHAFADAFGAEVLPVDTPEAWAVGGALTGTQPICRFWPHRTRGEGFTLAVIRKPDDGPLRTTRLRPTRRQPAAAVPEEMKRWLAAPEDYALERTADGRVRALPRAFRDLVTELEAHVYVLTAGVSLGEVKGRDAVPSAALALSSALRPEAFATVDLPRLEALRYLRHEALSLPADVPRGYVLAAYGGLPLGFMKQLGPRANNLFPDEWRIRKELI